MALTLLRMIHLKLMELYDRGLKSFESLSPLERDVFVLNDLDLYYEMEGGFEDYLLNGGHEPELSWLVDTLQRIGDADSASVIAELRQMDESRQDDMQPACEQYYQLRHQRWELMRQYLLGQGAELDVRA
jgi:hypothetical protein